MFHACMLASRQDDRKALVSPTLTDIRSRAVPTCRHAARVFAHRVFGFELEFPVFVCCGTVYGEGSHV
jgi:hypothetical protein